MNSHSTRIQLAFNSHSTRIALALHSHCTRIQLAFNSHCTRIALAFNSHSTRDKLAFNSRRTRIQLAFNSRIQLARSTRAFNSAALYGFVILPSQWQANFYPPLHRGASRASRCISCTAVHRGLTFFGPVPWVMLEFYSL